MTDTPSQQARLVSKLLSDDTDTTQKTDTAVFLRLFILLDQTNQSANVSFKSGILMFGLTDKDFFF